MSSMVRQVRKVYPAPDKSNESETIVLMKDDVALTLAKITFADIMFEIIT